MRERSEDEELVRFCSEVSGHRFYGFSLVNVLRG